MSNKTTDKAKNKKFDRGKKSPFAKKTPQG